MGTKLTEMRSGCFHAAMDDEPMFVLLARDPRAPDLVDEWADTREAEITRGNRPASDYAKVQEARQTAQSMREWRDANDGTWRAATLPFGDRMPPAPLMRQANPCIHGFSNHGEYCPKCNDPAANYESHGTLTNKPE